MSHINNKKKFIFMHPEKCAGGPLSNLIKKYFGHELTDLFFDNGKRNSHPDFSHILHLLDKPIDQYFKFAAIRNTWDRVVSMYFHAKKHLDYSKSFDDFVLSDGISGQKFLTRFHMKPKLTLDDQYIIDFTIRYENYEQDVNHVMNLLGIKDYTLEHCTHNTNRNKANYRDFYNKKTIDFVYDVFQWEINKFDFTY